MSFRLFSKWAFILVFFLSRVKAVVIPGSFRTYEDMGRPSVLESLEYTPCRIQSTALRFIDTIPKAIQLLGEHVPGSLVAYGQYVVSMDEAYGREALQQTYDDHFSNDPDIMVRVGQVREQLLPAFKDDDLQDNHVFTYLYFNAFRTILLQKLVAQCITGSEMWVFYKDLCRKNVYCMHTITNALAHGLVEGGPLKRMVLESMTARRSEPYGPFMDYLDEARDALRVFKRAFPVSMAEADFYPEGMVVTEDTLQRIKEDHYRDF